MAGSNQVGIEVGVKDKASAPLRQVAKAFEDLDRAASGSGGGAKVGDGLASLGGKMRPAVESAAKLAETLGAGGLGRGLQDLVGSIGRAEGAIGVGGLEGTLTRMGPAAMVAAAGLSAAVGAAKALATAGALAVGVVGAAATAAFTLASNSAQAADAAADSAANVGLSTEAYTRMAFAASQNASSTEAMAAGMRDMATRVAAQPKAFAQWGVTIRDVNGQLLSTEKVALNVADRMATLGTAAERNAMAHDLMGRSGRDLVQVMSLGSAGLAAFGAEADRVGATISTAAGIIAGEFNDQLDSTKDTFSAVAREAGSVFQPAITVAMESAQDLAARLLGHIGDNREAFEAFATKSVAMLARAFATLTEVGAGLSHVLEGVVSVFTYRFEDAFEGARGAAFEVAKEARHLAVELENGAALTRNQVIPAIEAETTARDNVIGSLGRERQARADLRETAGEAAASAMAAAKAAEGIGSAAGAGAAMVASNLLEQLGRLDALEAALGNVAGAFYGVRQAALENGATISQALLEEAAATAAARVEIQGMIADQRTRVREATAAAEEMVRIADQERARLSAARQVAQAEEEKKRKDRIAHLDASIAEDRRVMAEEREISKARNDTLNQQALSYYQMGEAVGSSFTTAFGALVSGSETAEDAASRMGKAFLSAAADAVQAQFLRATAAAAASAFENIPFPLSILAAGVAVGAVAGVFEVVRSVAGFNQGGMVPGSGLRDSVPALLTPGEYVLPRSVVHDIQSGSRPGPLSGGSGGGGGGVVNIQISSTIPATEAQMEEQLRPVLRVLERMGVQKGRRR